MEDDEPGGEVFAESIVDLERTAVEVRRGRCVWPWDGPMLTGRGAAR